MISSLHKLTIKSLFSYPEHSLAFGLLEQFEFPWEALSSLGDFIRELGRTLPDSEYEKREGDIYISKNAEISSTAFLGGPCIIGPGAEIRHCAFLRGSAIVGADAVVGNSVELKNCILFDSVQVPHFNYVGDSILGYRSHMGAGAVTSNVKSDKTPVTIRVQDEKIETGRKKFGAILGDFVEVGCNSVLNPGTVIGPHTNIYPLSSVRGYIPEESIYKSQNTIVPKEHR